MLIKSPFRQMQMVCMPFILSSCAQTHFYEDIYFSSLCGESGSHIYKTVENVSSIFQMRTPESLAGVEQPRLYNSDARWVGEQPYWNFLGDSWTGEYPTNFVIPNSSWDPIVGDSPVTNYSFEGLAKSSTDAEKKFIRITSEYVLTKPCASMRCYAETKHVFNLKGIDSLESRYGFTWEQITPKHFADRIIGAEWRIVDLKTGELLAEARDYILYPRFYCLSSHGCSNSGGRCMEPARDKQGTAHMFNARDFVSSVLKPPVTRSKKLYEHPN